MGRGRIVAQGPLEKVRAGRSLNQAFLELVGGRARSGDSGLTWLGAPGERGGRRDSAQPQKRAAAE